MLERAGRLRQFRFTWPTIDVAFLASATRWLMLALVVSVVAWLLFQVVRQANAEQPPPNRLPQE